MQGAALALLSATWVVASCNEDVVVEEASLLVSDVDAALTVQVVQELDPSAPTPSVAPVEIYNMTGDYVVAVADAEPRVVPIKYGENTADPTRDFMLVSVHVAPDFKDDIQQVQLHIDVGSDGTIDWCEPMDPDPISDGTDEGIFVLKLQPSCASDEIDPLTGDCAVSGSCQGYAFGCREDRLTFTLWNDISSVCHEQTDSE